MHRPHKQITFWDCDTGQSVQITVKQRGDRKIHTSFGNSYSIELGALTAVELGDLIRGLAADRVALNNPLGPV